MFRLARECGITSAKHNELINKKCNRLFFLQPSARNGVERIVVFLEQYY